MSGIGRFCEALDLFDALVRQVPQDGWDAPSPCTEWTARSVLGHVVGGLAMIQAMLDPRGTPPVVPADPAPDPTATWQHQYQRTRAQAARWDPQSAVSGPLGPTTVDDAVGQASVELLVHGWDLAQATGVGFTMPTILVVPLLEALEPLTVLLRASGAYGDEIAAPADAPAQQRLLAILGRRPAATTLDRSLGR